MKIRLMCLLLTTLLTVLPLAACVQTDPSQSGTEYSTDPSTGVGVGVENGTGTDTDTKTESVAVTGTDSDTDSESEGGIGTETEPRPWDPILVDAFVGFGDVGFELVYHDASVIDRYAAAIGAIAEDLSGLATVYELTAPAAACFGLTAEENIRLGASDPVAAMTYTHNAMRAQSDLLVSQNRLQDPMVILDVCDLLGEKYAAGEYVYFRTDHHWTGLGAYYASRYFMDLVGKSYLPLSAYREVTLTGFLGSLHRHTQSAAMAANPDTVYAYASPTVDTMTVYKSGSYQEVPMIRDSVSSSNKYLCFSYGDCPYYEIHNETVGDGSSVLVIKDSYGNAFMPMLADSYEYVYGIDYRSWDGDLSALVEERGIDTVVVINYQVCASLSSYVRTWESFAARQTEGS